MKRDRSEPLAKLRELFEESRTRCSLFRASCLTSGDIQGVLLTGGVAVICVDDADTDRIKKQVGVLVAETFPRLTPTSRASLIDGKFDVASKEWTSRKVSETGMALQSFRMPNKTPLVASRQGVFTCPKLKTVHLLNPLLAKAPLCVLENLSETNPSIHPVR